MLHINDIIGPVMIGPSSSHTAGAARIGRIARHLLNEPVQKANIRFYGSFLETHKGHGTDKAILAGLLDMQVDDPRLRESFRYAEEAGMAFSFGEAHLRSAHPNTAVLDLTGVSGKVLTMQAASVGGGNIRVDMLNGIAVSFTGRENTLIIPHRDEPGKIAVVTQISAQYSLNIGQMQVFRTKAGGTATMIIETDGVPSPRMLRQIQVVPGVFDVIFLSREL